MNRFIHSLLFWTLILCACSTSLPATEIVPLSPVTQQSIATELTPETFPDSPTLPIPRFGQTPPTLHIDQPPNGNEVAITPSNESCYYQWSYKDVPEINNKLDKEIKAINPSAQARATAFGEACVYTDGHTTLFSAVETDFYIHLPVNDLTDFKLFGDWIVQGMAIVEGLPADLIAGAKPGLVEFWFIKNGSEIVPVRVSIEKYNDEAAGKSGEELFKMFYIYPLPQ